MMSFLTLGLSEAILRALEEQGYSESTPIQAEAIPSILSGRDVMASAQTGTGKTASFTLPMLERLSQAPAAKQRKIRALILAPTRELADQVQASVRKYSQFLDLKSTAVYGGVKYFPQIRAIKRGVDILVATPGRLLDHIEQGVIDLSHIEVLVLDEADRMLDMGFIHDIRKVMNQMPKDSQRCLFSATFSKAIKELSSSLLNNPHKIEVAKQNEPIDTIKQTIYKVDKHRKREMLSHLIEKESWGQTLVFTRTKHGADRLCEQLEYDGIASTSIHGDKRQGARTRALKDFKRGKFQVLVATDVAARGLDIDALPHVVNYELSLVPEDYVHRIGRTGRAGKKGEAVSLVSADENKFVRAIEKLTGIEIPKAIIEGYEPTEKERSQKKPAGKKKPFFKKKHTANGRDDRPKRSFGNRKTQGRGKPDARGNNPKRKAGSRRASA